MQAPGAERASAARREAGDGRTGGGSGEPSTPWPSTAAACVRAKYQVSGYPCPYGPLP
jgi:hypothetical protein